MTITISGAELFAPSTQENPIGGVLWRAGRRIKARETSKKGLTDIERRHMLVGELAEYVVVKDYESRGFKVSIISWNEFNNFNGESGVDLLVQKGELIQKIQVKGSESGCRSVPVQKLLGYEREGVSKIIFVSVREVTDPRSGGRCFECEVTSQLSPRQMKLSSSWIDKKGKYIHVENDEYIQQWSKTSARMGAKKILSPKDVWL